MKSECIVMVITTIGLIVNIAALVALWSNLAAIWYNIKHFRKGGIRITYMSNAYIIKSGNLDGKVIYQSSKSKEDYVMYREKGMIEHYEEIPKFIKWNMSHCSDDIRVPQYPLSLLS